MKVLLTGASGFLGRYIQNEFSERLITLGRDNQNSISCDLAKVVPSLPPVDLVIHNAGLAHVLPKTPDEERKFYQVNLFGTQNLLKALDNSEVLPSTIVFISTVAVYGLERGELISEIQTPKPHTPYGKSKYEAELLLHHWAQRNQVKLLILRLPLVAGVAGTPGNLGAMLKAIQKGYYFRVGPGLGKKSMVLAQDVAKLLTRVVNLPAGVYNLTDGMHPSLSELDSYLSDSFGKKVKTLPLWILQPLSKIGDVFSFFPLNSYRLTKLGDSLTFDDSKARKNLAWNPKPVIGNLKP